MFFEVTAISKDGNLFSAKFICEDKKLASEGMERLIEQKGWEHYRYHIQFIKKLSTEELDKHLRKEEDFQ